MLTAARTILCGILRGVGLSESQAEQIVRRFNQEEEKMGLQGREDVTPKLASKYLGAVDKFAATAAVKGLGAWTFVYRLGWTPATDRQRAGLRAMKQALIDNGYAKGIVLSALVFGDAATARTKEFQAKNGLVADGILGPKTGRALMRHYTYAAETDFAIPQHFVQKLAVGESNCDPIAEGIIDADDEGILQFHLPYWPGTTLAQAWDPTYEIRLAGERLADYRTYTGSWRGALAAWNIGLTYARAWVKAGYPATGGPQMGVDEDGDPIFAYERATAYVAYVESLPS